MLVRITRVLVPCLVKSLVVIELLHRNLPQMAHRSDRNLPADGRSVRPRPRACYPVVCLHEFLPFAVTLLEEPVLGLVEGLVTFLGKKRSVEELIVVRIVGSLGVKLGIGDGRIFSVSSSLYLVESLDSIAHVACSRASFCES